MKKILIIMTIIVSILVINKKDTVEIPKESIRLRIVANSDSKNDQKLKKEIVTNLSTEIEEIEKIDNIEITREYIKNNMEKYEDIVEKTILDNGYSRDFHINYGKNYFPKKVYKDVIYNEGEYESLVVTLGEGNGHNFWCVLFPPLCLVDEQEENIEYKSFVKEIIKKYF